MLHVGALRNLSYFFLNYEKSLKLILGNNLWSTLLLTYFHREYIQILEKLLTFFPLQYLRPCSSCLIKIIAATSTYSQSSTLTFTKKLKHSPKLTSREFQRTFTSECTGLPDTVKRSKCLAVDCSMREVYVKVAFERVDENISLKIHFCFSIKTY